MERFGAGNMEEDEGFDRSSLLEGLLELFLSGIESGRKEGEESRGDLE